MKKFVLIMMAAGFVSMAITVLGLAPKWSLFFSFQGALGIILVGDKVFKVG